MNQKIMEKTKLQRLGELVLGSNLEIGSLPER